MWGLFVSRSVGMYSKALSPEQEQQGSPAHPAQEQRLREEEEWRARRVTHFSGLAAVVL